MVTRRQTRWIATVIILALALSFARHWRVRRREVVEQQLPSYEAIKAGAGLPEHVSSPPPNVESPADQELKPHNKSPSPTTSNSLSTHPQTSTLSTSSNVKTTVLSRPQSGSFSSSEVGKSLPLLDIAVLKSIQNSDLSEAAHRLPSAEDFIPHFRAVVDLPDLTIRAAKSTCKWTGEQNVNFQYGEESDWVRQDRNNTEILGRRRAWQQQLMHDMVPYGEVKNKFSGRGFVILAGNGADTLLRLKVQLQILADYKTDLPVEIHYFEHELTQANRTEMRSWYDKIHFNDLGSPDNIMATKHGLLANYHLKTASLLNSRFAEPFLLDSDNLPVIDPMSLYNSTTYKEYGTVFWPDIARSRPQNPMWAITNTPCKMDEYEQESGQLLVDKRKFWYHLQLATWFNHQEYYNGFLLGDKDMFRFAWHALKTKYGRPKKWLTSVGVVHEDGFYCGHSFAQHHPDDGSVAFLHGGLLKTMHKSVMEHTRQRGRLFDSYKRSKFDEDWTEIERVTIEWDKSSYMDKKPPMVISCTSMDNIEPSDLDDIVPNWEERYIKAGGYEALNDWLQTPQARLQDWTPWDELPWPESPLE